MREPPPVQLVQLLQQLGLATAKDLQSVEPAVHRMAGDLPRFQSVWIDALRHARLITQFQAAEIMADRGDRLRIGRYVLCHVVQECGYATVCKASDIESHQPFRLAITSPATADTGDLLPKLQELIAVGHRLPQTAGLITAAGRHGVQLWAAAPWVEGTSAAEQMLHHGRFPPEVVAEIARAMLAELAAMDQAGLVHGDIRVENVLLLPDGRVCLPHAGLRGILRPHEGIAHCDLAPEACGALAPERVAGGTPPSVASDLFACGCVWWQMLCGRPPLGGGDTRSRLRLAQTAAIDDFRHWATGVPAPLVEAVAACLKREPRDRPRSMAALAQRLGPPSRAGRQAIARCLAAAAQPRAPWLNAKRKTAKKNHPHAWTAATLLLMAAVAVAWPLWVARNRPHAAGWSAGAAQQAADRTGTSIHSPKKHASKQATERELASSSPVVQAAYNEAGEGSRPVGEPRATSGNVLRLPAGRIIPADALQLQAGQTVTATGGRARVAVPAHGMAVQADGVTFENIDFVADETPARSLDRDTSLLSLREKAADEEDPVLITVACPECTFVGCSFQSPIGGPDLRTAIRWGSGADSARVTELPSGRMRMKNCIFRRVVAGIALHRRGAVALEFVNSMHLGPGPMVRLERFPSRDEPLKISLSQVTLRDADALVHFRCRGEFGETPSGDICVDAKDCVFAPRDEGKLLLLACSQPPQKLLRELKWTGQGSVIGAHAVFATWQPADRAPQPVDDATISISGLVRGRIDFAGPCDGNPANSRVLQCQAPLEDSDCLGASGKLPADVAAPNTNSR